MVSGHLEVRKGYYYVILNYLDENGKRKRRWFPTHLQERGNKRKAEKILTDMRSDFQPPKTVSKDLSSDMPFADFLEQWAEIIKPRVAIATYANYCNQIRHVLGPYFRAKNISLQELQARHIQSFYTEALKTVSTTTVIHYHALIHTSLKYALKMDMVLQNVADKVDRPKKKEFHPVFINDDEMQQLFQALKGDSMELPVMVAAFYGFRRGEVLGLKWDSIDFEKGTISVMHTVTAVNVDGKYQVVQQDTAKTKSSLRTLPLVSSFKEYFQQVKDAQEYNKEVCGNCYNYDYDGYVFVDEMGNLMDPSYLTNRFPKFCVDHGLRRMRFHDLRHSCASLLLANGVPLKSIQEWLGHSDFGTTANIYAHLDYRSKLTSAAAMETGLTLPDSLAISRSWDGPEPDPAAS